ncbi:N-acetylmuramic acid 6-phosphate etherase [Mycoplasmopsis anatis]|uniref:N-acetylmuramic acid 6-phosphate etherase n=1 Tax=Mycoplasmopsis anatis TaxID=171279 RepID=UPI001C4DFADC|nr:N-acetylmuramic acid 6-phosphate etherase [Mycoplasmopsis anatis]MBW0594377.1 N-acetylmuramic acid 6-phosphate etherase [Mycoplasmopsis anatis]MBW0595002.1 N-acetylmuramic acid 6-phosphate etherase [Mycoplasmopsis anatis]MBW0598247.1 N-acetylmuramic acid 6-phosphate etherase [Mycoplasmopsis anatis]MBW0600963.1 N-acetylmuramic acid 6-phosphate etherase [Mycoplasmopsis anatis]MBW0601576.1 N-acetylmuramic acid 6-phosphate etherase [Mycoplasmopsis anatis]
MNEISKLDTEQRNQRTTNLSKVSTIEIVEKFNYEDSLVPPLVLKNKEQISQIIEIAYKQLKEHDGRIVYIGAGTSGRIGILDASEIYPTFGVKNKVIGIIAGGMDAIITPKEGSEDDTEQAIRDLQNINLTQNDILIGLTASGRTPYVVSGLEYAKKIGAKTAFVCNSINSPTSKLVDVAVEIETGAETITGSTRLKAGTSQKLVCNIISSSVMIKLGYVEENFMINVVPSNQKLRERCINMIMQITKKPRNFVEEIFKVANNVKISILMIENNWNYEKAKEEYEKIYG